MDYHVEDATHCAVFASQHLESLFLGKGSRMDLVLGRNMLLRTNALTLDGARLDLAGESNHVVINDGMAQRDVLVVYLRAGRQPDWSGPGIMTSWRANTHSGIASFFNSDPTGLPILNSFAGEAVAAEDVLLGLREFGDLNLDRRIDIDDYFAVDVGYSRRHAGYQNGDIDYDEDIDADDHFLMDAGFLQQGGPLAAGRGVPEWSPFSEGVIDPVADDDLAVWAMEDRLLP